MFLLGQDTWPGTENKKTQMSRKEEKLLSIILSQDENKDKTKENKHHHVKIVKMLTFRTLKQIFY